MGRKATSDAITAVASNLVRELAGTTPSIPNVGAKLTRLTHGDRPAKSETAPSTKLTDAARGFLQAWREDTQPGAAGGKASAWVVTAILGPDAPLKLDKRVRDALFARERDRRRRAEKEEVNLRMSRSTRERLGKLMQGRGIVSPQVMLAALVDKEYEQHLRLRSEAPTNTTPARGRSRTAGTDRRQGRLPTFEASKPRSSTDRGSALTPAPIRRIGRDKKPR